MANLKNDRFIRALLRQPVDKTPVWIMRQAGRYLPEYREMRASVPDFVTFCKTPELACEATLQPLRRFDLDAAIIFSDILTVVDALGFDLEFVSGKGPVVHNPVRCKADVADLPMTDCNDHLNYVFTAVNKTVKALDGKVPLIGFAGSPWTVACYMVEGGSSKTFFTIRQMMYAEPETLKHLLNVLARVTTAYLNEQIKAGASAIMLFDTWGGVLSPACYQAFSLHYMQQIADGLIREHDGKKIPLIFFTKMGGQWLETIADAGCDALGLDWMTDIALAKKRVGHKVALQGNMDPALLLTNPECVKKAVNTILKSYGGTTGHVFNLGHGIDKTTPIDNVSAMVDAVHDFAIHEKNQFA